MIAAAVLTGLIVLAWPLVEGAYTRRAQIRQPAGKARLGSQASDSVVRRERNYTLQPHGTDVWVFRFTGMRAAQVVVETSAQRTLSCRVLSSSGLPLATDGPGAACVLKWTPSRTGAYRVEVDNPHSSEISYDLRVHR
ncbi:MAG: hypothetical protein ACRENP_13640 [Longimicrobiales bacterium]